MILTIENILELKKELNERFGIYLHMHDACGAQYFSFDSAVDDDVADYVSNYASKHKCTVIFSDKKDSFTLK